MNDINATQETQAQETQANPLEHAYVSASYAQGLETLIKELNERIAKLQENPQPPLTLQFLSALDAYIEEKVTKAVAKQEDNIRQIAEDAAEAKITEHTDEYNHYEMECAIERIDDKIEEAVSEALEDVDFEDKINDALRHASISISV